MHTIIRHIGLKKEPWLWLDDKYHLISNKHVEQTIDQLGIETLDFLSKYGDEFLSLIFLNKKNYEQL
jgi:hypothetical protein